MFPGLDAEGGAFGIRIDDGGYILAERNVHSIRWTRNAGLGPDTRQSSLGGNGKQRDERHAGEVMRPHGLYCFMTWHRQVTTAAMSMADDTRIHTEGITAD
jgi:hypothetical protein